jgi:hypothetical protein
LRARLGREFIRGQDRGRRRGREAREGTTREDEAVGAEVEA